MEFDIANGFSGFNGASAIGSYWPAMSTVVGGSPGFQPGCVVGVAPVAVSLLSGMLGGTTMIGHALAWVCALTSLLGALIFALGRRGFAAPLAQA